MILKAIYESKADVPAGFDELYTEREGKFELTGIEGAKTQADVDRVHGALVKERAEHSQTRTALKVWGDRKPDEVLRSLDELEELRVKVGEGPDDKKLEEIVTKRVQIALRPVERQRDEALTKNVELTGRVGELEGSITRRSLADTIREATIGDKGVPVRSEQIPDLELLAPMIFEIVDGKHVTREGNPLGVIAGLEPRAFLEDVLNSGRRPQWFKDSEGTGSRPGGRAAGAPGGVNPFAKESFNLTAIGQLVRSNPALATRLARAAKGTQFLPPELR
jgi:hypothetical protein